MRDRIEKEIRGCIATTIGVSVPVTNPLKLSTIYLPLDPDNEIWRVWYDLEGEEAFWFGAEVRPSGEVVAFAED